MSSGVFVTTGAGSERWGLSVAPATNSGFVERQAVRIFKPPAGTWSFRVDDEPLADASDTLDPAWLWSPGFFAGEVTAELVAEDGTTACTFLLDVSPDNKKLGRDVFGEMLRELWGEDPALVIGTEPATTHIGAMGPERSPFLTLARLRRYGPAFLRALESVSREPIRVRRAARETVPLHRARRLDRQSVDAAFRNPDLAPLFRAAARSRSVRVTHQATIEQPIAELDLDSPANRCLLAMGRAVLSRTIAVREAIARKVATEETSATATALSPRWPARRMFLDMYAQRLQRLLRQSPFNGLHRAEVTAAGLNAVSAHPLYARAHGLGWRIVRPGVSGPPENERLWISPTWEIFERWCFVRIARALRERHRELAWAHECDHPSGALAAWRGTDGVQTIEVMLQPRFRSEGHHRSVRFGSVSGLRIPDIVISRDGPSGDRFLVLDAKYRQSRESILESMSSAHVYHDALRKHGRAPDRALLLVPAGGGAPWLEHSEFVRAEGVGVAVLNPGGETQLFEQLGL